MTTTYAYELHTYRIPGMEQMRMTIEGYNARVLLTRFKGNRTWSVCGTHDPEAYKYEIVLRDGERTRFVRATALRLAEQFIRTGREFL